MCVGCVSSVLCHGGVPGVHFLWLRLVFPEICNIEILPHLMSPCLPWRVGQRCVRRFWKAVGCLGLVLAQTLACRGRPWPSQGSAERSWKRCMERLVQHHGVTFWFHPLMAFLGIPRVWGRHVWPWHPTLVPARLVLHGSFLWHDFSVQRTATISGRSAGTASSPSTLTVPPSWRWHLTHEPVACPCSSFHG